MESYVLQYLDFKLTVPSPLSFAEVFVRVSFTRSPLSV